MSDQQTEPQPANVVQYATPMPGSRAPATWAAAVIAFVGLGLILLGGCFLIGIEGMPFNNNNFAGHGFFVGVLYCCAFASFAGAIWLLVLSIGRLLKISKGE